MSARVVVVAGPTASGKTDLALAMARALGGELVGGDSVQVYRGFDVGSAKPSAAELDGVAHHLIDVVDPDEAIDAARYAALADAAIAETRARGHVPIVVGGTGLWLRALLRGLVEVPLPDAALRARLLAEAEREGAPSLHARLAAHDPRAAAAIHPNDAVRITRALEVREQTGRALGELRHEHSLGAPRYDAHVLVLDRERGDLRARIAARTSQMLRAGWVDEVRALRARWGDAIRGLGSVGYREIVRHLDGEIPSADLEARIASATWTYVRRQRTWWKSEPGVSRRAHPDDARALIDEARAWLAR